MRFADLLRTTVLLSAASATLLAAVTVLQLSAEYDPALATVAGGWWAIALTVGLRLGRGTGASPAIARLLATARHQTSLPELRPAATMLNRLWPLLLASLGSGIVGTFFPQVAAIATGFFIIWALAWRRQHMAVLAIEERDAARFYVDRTSPFAAIKLVRTPGFGGTFLQTPA